MSASADFDGSGTYITYGDIDLLEGASTFTISMWFYLDVLNSENKIMAEWDLGNQWLVDVFSAGSLQFLAQDGANRSRYGTADATIASGQWYHAGIVWGGQQTWNCYLDGVDETLSNKGSSGTVNSIGVGAAHYTIGSSQGGNSAINGRLAYVHVYDTNLTEEEVAELRFKPMSITRNLVSYVPFVSNSSNLSLDWIRNDTGTVNGTLSEDLDGPPVFFP